MSCIIGTMFVAPARSQTFTGVITDSAGHVIPGAEARLASMDTRTVARVVASANGTFSVTAPHTKSGLRRYFAELCAPGFAPQVQVVPMALGDTLVVRGSLRKSTTRVVPLGPGTCAWDARTDMSITGGRGFGVSAATTMQMVDSIMNSPPNDHAPGISLIRSEEAGWLRRLHAARSAMARERAAWIVLQLAGVSSDTLDAATLTELQHALPPTSRWWEAGVGLVPMHATETLFGAELRDTRALTLAARRRARDYIAGITAAKLDPDVDAQAKHELALFELGMRDTAAATAQAKALIAAYPGYIASRLAVFRMPWLSPLRSGNRMPAFDFAELRGTSQTRLTNADLHAPYTLLVFWGTWCAPCVKELPQLDSLHAEYHARGLDIVSVAADDSPEVVSDFIRARDMPWRQAYAGTTQDPSLARLGILGYPTAVVIDSTGTIRASHFGSVDLRSTVAPFLTR